MERRRLGHSDIMVSKLCLGTMTWGQQNNEAEAFEQMDYAVDQGINFFDTAELYPIPPKRDTQGRTEEIIGEWLRARGNRDRIVLATKICGKSKMNWFRADGSPCELSPRQLAEALDGSLRRLGTDYIDLYQLHWPGRPMRLFGGLGFQAYPGEGHDIEETLQVLQEFRRAGKIREVGLSNETPYGVMRALKAAEMLDVPRVVSVQNAYSLISRVFETGLSEVAHYEGVGLLAYSPLAQGYLTGKYQGGAMPKGSRKQLFDRLQRYETPGADAAIEAYLALAQKYGLDPAQMAIKFVTDQPFVTSNIIGATSMAQLKTNIASNDIRLGDALMEEIEHLHLLHTNPCP